MHELSLITYSDLENIEGFDKVMDRLIVLTCVMYNTFNALKMCYNIS